MKIVISLLGFRPGRIGGTETYLHRLLENLPLDDGRDDIIVLTYRDIFGRFKKRGLREIPVNVSAKGLAWLRFIEAVTPYRARFVESMVKKINPDVILFPQQSIFPKALPFPSVLTVMDLQHLSFPRNFSLLDRAFRAGIYAYSLVRADRLIAISRFVRDTVIREYALPEDKIVAIPLGLDQVDLERIRPWDKIKGPYLYYPAASHPHKNHALLIDTFATLKARGDITHKLIFTGQKTAHWRRLAKQIRILGLEREIIHLGFVSDETVSRLYKGAEVIVFPSRYEGFGLPVLEAAAHCKPLLTSRLEIFSELGVPRRNQIDFESPEEVHRALHQPEPTVLETRPWTWREMAEETLQVMKDVAQN